MIADSELESPRPSRTSRSAGSAAATRSPPRCSGSAAPERASSSASRCPSTAATPPAEPTSKEPDQHDADPDIARARRSALSDFTPVRATFGEIELTARLQHNFTGMTPPPRAGTASCASGELDGDMAAVKRLPEGARVTIEPTG